MFTFISSFVFIFYFAGYSTLLLPPPLHHVLQYELDTAAVEVLPNVRIHFLKFGILGQTPKPF